MKRFLVSFLALCMIGSMVPATALAEDALPEELFETEELLPEEIIPAEDEALAEIPPEEVFPEAQEEAEAYEMFNPLSLQTIALGSTYIKFRITYNLESSFNRNEDYYVGIALKAPGDEDWTFYWADENSSMRGRYGNITEPGERNIYGLTPDTTYSRYAFVMDKDHNIIYQTDTYTTTTKSGSIPSDSIANFVLRCYTRGLGRPEDQVRSNDLGGLEYWYDILSNRQISPAEVGRYFAISDESKAKYPENADFVAMLYRLFMEDRSFDQGGFDYWMGLLKDGTLTREQVIDYFGISPEFQAIVAGYGLA